MQRIYRSKLSELISALNNAWDIENILDIKELSKSFWNLVIKGRTC